MSIQSLYLQKRTTADEAVRLVKNGDFIIVPTGVGEPPALLAALSDQRHGLQGEIGRASCRERVCYPV